MKQSDKSSRTERSRLSAPANYISGTKTKKLTAQNEENTQNAAQLAQETKVNAEKCKTKMQDMIKSMDELKESSSIITNTIKKGRISEKKPSVTVVFTGGSRFISHPALFRNCIVLAQKAKSFSCGKVVFSVPKRCGF
jgi:hypothetical protein